MFDKINKDVHKKLPPIVIFTYTYKDIDKVIKILEMKKDVIVNVSNMDKIKKYRIIDFLSGYIYAKNGIREKYEEDIFLFHY